MVNVFGLGGVEPGGVGFGTCLYFIECGDDALGFTRPSGFPLQRWLARMGAARGKLLRQQAAVEVRTNAANRSKAGSSGWPKSARPHFHAVTAVFRCVLSARSLRAERDGQSENADEAFGIFLVVAVAHGELKTRSVRYSEYSDLRLTPRRCPCRARALTVPVTCFCVLSTKASSASRSGVNHRPK